MENSLNHYIPYLFGLGSNLAFGTASVFFTHLTQKHSPNWINTVKAMVGLVGFFFGLLLVESWAPLSPLSLGLAFLSGFIGLFVGDYFLFKAFSTLGASRTLVIYSFQPILLGIYGYIFLSQTLNFYQVLSIIFMISCVLTFVLERKGHHGKWDLHLFLFAFLAIFLDAVGVMLTRTVFESTPGLGSFQLNFVRAVGALLGVLIFLPKTYSLVFQDFSKMTSKQISKIIAIFSLGTFLSLTLYLQALKTAHVATLTAISITGPIWASLFEHISHKKFPNRYLWVAMTLFFIGFGFMAAGIDP